MELVMEGLLAIQAGGNPRVVGQRLRSLVPDERSSRSRPRRRHEPRTRRQRPPRKHEEEEHENHERWAVSYGDMMTVLLALFIVLYAISVVDKTKFDQLRISLAIGFGRRAVSMLDGSSGPLNGVESFQIAPDFTGVSARLASPRAPTRLVQLTRRPRTFSRPPRSTSSSATFEKQIEDALGSQGLERLGRLQDQRPRARRRHRRFGRLLRAGRCDAHVDRADAWPTRSPLRCGTSRGQISIEGHANVLPSQQLPDQLGALERQGHQGAQAVRRVGPHLGKPDLGGRVWRRAARSGGNLVRGARGRTGASTSLSSPRSPRR